ncbi:hypothetical protein E4U43_000214 [Claviceps pusilla]|uniref:Uncharacterized protein n=1 Tax=Claviceps pusilla TaxID=123648 RepID=A0A9P7NBX5_9HYPO|nr:hypothetical protein E4U43_000214 [Claviceps pusilla]
MKVSVITTLLTIAGAALAKDYALTCARGMWSGPNDDDSALAYFRGLYTYICINAAHCEHSAPPILGALGAMVNGGCVNCPDDLNPNLVGDCTLAPVHR